jgi:small conductance mechanosensitive channel
VLRLLMRRPRQTAFHHAPARARSLTLQTAQRARRARRELIVLVPLVALTIAAYVERERLFGLDAPIRVAAAMLLLALGYALARDIGRFIAPALFRRMDPATAGTVGFLIRLAFLVVAALAALRIAGLTPRTLAVGGAITAVVVGLAAQQTLGNLIAGMVLIAARPFKVGERVRLQAGGLAGQLEGTVAALGLLYTTFSQGQDSIMVPNNIVLTAAVVPLREPASVDLRARLRPDVKPSQIQRLLEEGVTTPLRSEPHIALEEVDRDEVVVRVAATPSLDSDGPRLADEVLASLEPVTRVAAGMNGNGERSGAGDEMRGQDGGPIARGEAADDAVADDGGRPADHGLRPRPGRVSQGYGS